MTVSGPYRNGYPPLVRTSFTGTVNLKNFLHQQRKTFHESWRRAFYMEAK